MTLQHFDIRFNKVKPTLPHSMIGMRNLTRMNIRGNGISEMNMAELPFMEFLNCSDNALRSLALNEGPIIDVIAKNNCKWDNHDAL
jgi:Leucine-rich repeat (LRR) protein